jgi:hypothetical protein
MRRNYASPVKEVIVGKIDLKKELKHLYNPSTQAVSVVDVPEMPFLMIDGSGDPNTSAEYAAAVEALFAVAYALKFHIKRLGDDAPDYVVMPLEGLWWADDMARFSTGDKAAWKWTMLIVQPAEVTARMVEETVREVKRKKQLSALNAVRLESYHEGLSAQIMHIGPYAAEGPTIAKLHDHIQQSGHSLDGKHHEIYLSDPRRIAPEKMRTVVRQPFR